MVLDPGGCTTFSIENVFACGGISFWRGNKVENVIQTTRAETSSRFRKPAPISVFHSIKMSERELLPLHCNCVEKNVLLPQSLFCNCVTTDIPVGFTVEPKTKFF